MPRSKKSTYYFIGKLSDRSAMYNVQEFPLSNGFFLEVFLDGISIWGSADKTFTEIFPEIKEVFNIIISSFIFRNKKPMTYTLETWIEAREIISKKNTIGWILKPFMSRKHYSKENKKNEDWKKSAWLYNNLSKGNSNHTLALKDYRSALTDPSNDAFLFAYRSIEDICRAVTGCDEIKKKNWEQMHEILGTSEKSIKPLNEIAKKIRHGNRIHKSVVKVDDRDKIINIAHSIIKKELERKFANFLK
jgi:hypothetical protein